jgi:hypothetical protein
MNPGAKRPLVSSIESEFHRYKQLAEGAMRQLDEPDLNRSTPGFNNSIAVLVWHISGNLKSRFTDFIETDGEKPWRARDEEFVARTVTRDALFDKWEEGWRALFGALEPLSDSDLERTVTIRQQPLRVDEALHRSLSHTSYHVGQIVYVAKLARGSAWDFMSIPPGKSNEYNANPTKETAHRLKR